MLKTCASPLCEAYDLGMLDLDGVVYIGGSAIPGAAASVAEARARGMRIAFVTNNAARTPEVVASHLEDLGVEARAGDVVTSAQAAAAMLRERFGRRARIAALGAAGLHEALRAVDLVPVRVDAPADAAVTGFGPDVVWQDIMRLAARIRDGLPWVASNTDASLPTPYGEAPGHGVLVDMLARFSGVTPAVAGKPAPPLLQETMRRVGGRRPLMVGDRLDTDIEGGTAVGVDTLLVLTGVTALDDLVGAPPDARPSFIATDLGGLLRPHDAPSVEDGRVALGGWTAVVEEGALSVSGAGDPDDWWRVAAVAAWCALDTTGTAVRTDGLVVPEHLVGSEGGSLPA